MGRISKYERTRENDIKFRGPLSYQHMLIFGWLCISCKVFAVVCSFYINLDAVQPQWVYTMRDVGDFFGYFALPLFLLANFAVILDKKRTYKEQLIKFGGLSLAIVIVFVILKEHNVVGIFAAALQDREAANKLVTDVLYDSAVDGSLIFNLFIDLFLCTLFMFFLEYVPEKHFQGKKLRLFRAMALIPVLYEVGALLLRISFSTEKAKPPYIVYPLLTTKPFMSFILFIFLALHIKREKTRFLKNGKTEKEFEAFTQTNDHSLRFSIFTSVMILITGMADLVLYLVFVIVLGVSRAGVDLTAEFTVEAERRLYDAYPMVDKIVSAWRIGTHFPMILLIPVVLLFSYTRRAKNDDYDLYIPIGGVVLAALVGWESVHQGLVMNLSAIANYVAEFSKTFIK